MSDLELDDEQPDPDPVKYDSSIEDQTIAFATDPWLEDDVTGEPLRLLDFLEGPLNQRAAGWTMNSCDTCYGLILPGVLAAVWGGDSGIERCDACQIFDGDFTAAAALAAHLSPIVGHPLSVWFTPATQ